MQCSAARDGGSYNSLVITFDEADVSAPFQARNLDFCQIVGSSIEPEVFFEIMIGHEVSSHGGPIELAVFDDNHRATFNEFAERMVAAGDPAEKAMQENENEAAPDGREKTGRAIDCTRQNRSQNDQQDCVESRFLGKRPSATNPDQHQGDQKNNHAAQRDLQKGQLSRLHTQTEKLCGKIGQSIHSKN